MFRRRVLEGVVACTNRMGCCLCGTGCRLCLAGQVRQTYLHWSLLVRDASGADSALKRVNARLPVRGSIVSIEMIFPVLSADGARAGMSSSTSATAGGTGLLGLGATARHDARVVLCWGTCVPGVVGASAVRPRAARCVCRTGSEL